MKKFNHLNVPQQWQQYWTRYPEGYSIIEALINWISQVDDMVDSYNELTDHVNNFKDDVNQSISDFNGTLTDFLDQFDDNLKGEVTTILNEWQDSGFLDIVISDAIQTQIDEVDERLTPQLAQTMKYKGEYVNAIKMGAIGDGSQDDSEIINQLLQDYRYVNLPPGNYRLDNPINMPGDSHLIGASPKQTNLVAYFGNDYMINYGNNYNYNGYRGKIKGIRLTTDITGAENKPKGIYLNSGIDIEDVDFYTIGQVINRDYRYIDLIRINRVYIGYCVPNGQPIVYINGNADAVEINQMKLEAFDKAEEDIENNKNNGVYISRCHGGSIKNSILNSNVVLDKVNAFSLENIHNEYRGGGFYINASNVTMKDIFKFKSEQLEDVTILTDESNSGFQSIVTLENYVNYIIGHHMDTQETWSDDIYKDNLSILNLKNCSRVINLADNGRTMNNQVGLSISNIPNFLYYSTKTSLDSVINMDNTFDTDINFNGDNEDLGGSIGAIVRGSHLKWKKQNDVDRTYYYRTFHVIDEKRKLSNGRTSIKNISGVSYNSDYVAIGFSGNEQMAGKGGYLLILRGTEMGVFTEKCMLPNNGSDYLIDTGITCNTYQWQNIEATDGLNDYTRVNRMVRKNNNVIIYQSTPPDVGTYEKYDRVINSDFTEGNVKEWIYSGSEWLENGTW